MLWNPAGIEDCPTGKQGIRSVVVAWLLAQTQKTTSLERRIFDLLFGPSYYEPTAFATKSTMGSAVSVTNLPDIKREWLEVFEAMKLKRGEVKTLHDLFGILNVDKSGSIGVTELLALLEVPRTAFAERIYGSFDKDLSGRIDFYEFVISSWKICTLGDGSLGNFFVLHSISFVIHCLMWFVLFLWLYFVQMSMLSIYMIAMRTES